jgi:putative membrane protein
MNNVAQEQKYKKIITALSVIIPLAVAGLFLVNLKKLGFNVEPLSFLPPIYASINGLTAVLLIAAVIAIKNGNKKLHEQLNTFAIGCSLVFFTFIYCLSHDLRFNQIWWRRPHKICLLFYFNHTHYFVNSGHSFCANNLYESKT